MNITQNQLAWAIRTTMVVAAAVILYLLGQKEIALDPLVRVVLNCIVVGIAALNPSTVASKVTTQ